MNNNKRKERSVIIVGMLPYEEAEKPWNKKIPCNDEIIFKV